MWHFQGTPFMTESVCNNICLSYEKKNLILERMFGECLQGIHVIWYLCETIRYIYIYRKTFYTHYISRYTLFTKLDAYSTQSEKIFIPSGVSGRLSVYYDEIQAEQRIFELIWKVRQWCFDKSSHIFRICSNPWISRFAEFKTVFFFYRDS